MRTLLAAGMAVLIAASGVRAQCVVGEGYPLRVHATGGAVVDTAYLNAVARTFAFRWQVPSDRRGDYTLWRRARNRAIPPEPRWADDWRPSPAHRARVTAVVYRKGRIKLISRDSLSGDEKFDRTIESIMSDPMPNAPGLPAWPASVTPDSLVLVTTFGDIDAPVPHGLIRFAFAQTPVTVVPGTLQITAPRTGSTPSASTRRAQVSYEVTERGVLRPGSFQVLESTDRELTDAIRSGLFSARFNPATSNCRPISMSVLQDFRG